VIAPSEETDFVQYLEACADAFAAAIASRPSVRHVDTPDFLLRAKRNRTLMKPVVWRNEIFVGPEFRWAHVEYFSIRSQIGVVHVCLLPALDRQAPIFGFDIICGGRKATGAFLDLSPTTADAAAISNSWAVQTGREMASFQEKRMLPDWATSVFSQHALAIRPVSSGEVERVMNLAESSLAHWFSHEKRKGNAKAMVSAQQRYVAAQRRNEHTLRMLAGCVGDDIAKEFVSDWLFPGPLNGASFFQIGQRTDVA